MITGVLAAAALSPEIAALVRLAVMEGLERLRDETKLDAVTFNRKAAQAEAAAMRRYHDEVKEAARETDNP